MLIYDIWYMYDIGRWIFFQSSAVNLLRINVALGLICNLFQWINIIVSCSFIIVRMEGNSKKFCNVSFLSS